MTVTGGADEIVSVPANDVAPRWELRGLGWGRTSGWQRAARLGAACRAGPRLFVVSPAKGPGTAVGTLSGASLWPPAPVLLCRG